MVLDDTCRFGNGLQWVNSDLPTGHFSNSKPISKQNQHLLRNGTVYLSLHGKGRLRGHKYNALVPQAQSLFLIHSMDTCGSSHQCRFSVYVRLTAYSVYVSDPLWFFEGSREREALMFYSTLGNLCMFPHEYSGARSIMVCERLEIFTRSYSPAFSFLDSTS